MGRVGGPRRSERCKMIKENGQLVNMLNNYKFIESLLDFYSVAIVCCKDETFFGI